MKIAILAATVGTVFKFRFELVQEFLKRGDEVFLLVQNENEDLFLEKLKKIGCNIIEIKISRRGLNPLKDLGLIWSYYKTLKKIEPTVVLNYTIKPNIYGGIICQMLNIPYIATITGVGSAFQKENLLNKLLVFLYKISFKKASKVFFQNSDNLKKFIRKNIVKRNQVVLINGSGVNLNKFYPVKRNRKCKKIIFLFIGRIMKEKGIQEYLNCAENILKIYENVEFRIMGQFEENNYYKKIMEFEKKGIVKYLGVSNDVRNQIKDVDCVINPSWHEGMSNVLLEAGAMKKFLISSDIPGCSEIVINNRTGLTFKVKDEKDLENKILYYLSLKNEVIENIIDESYSFIKTKFDRDKIVDKYKIILENIKENQNGKRKK